MKTAVQNADKVWGVLLVLMVSALSGCAGSGIAYTRLPEDADPAKEVEALTKQYKQDQTAQVGVYAPESFGKAEEAYGQAQTNLEKNRSNSDILDDVARARAYLGQAETRAQQVKNELGFVVNARSRALQAGAVDFTSSRDPFERADGQLEKIARDSDTAHGVTQVSDTARSGLIAQYKLAELHAVEQKQLGHARETIQNAQSDGAEELAPKSLAAAEAKLSQGVLTVRQDPRNVLLIESAAEAANRYADHLLVVTRAAKANLKKHPEEIAAVLLSDEQAVSDLERKGAKVENASAVVQSLQ